MLKAARAQNDYIASILDGEVADGEIAAVLDGDPVWTADSLLTIGVENVVSVNRAWPLYSDVFNVFTPDQCLVPLRAANHATFHAHRSTAPGFSHWIVRQVLAAQQRCARGKPEGDIALEIHGSCKVGPGGNIHRSSPGFLTRLDSPVDGCRIQRHSVANCAVLLNIEECPGLSKTCRRKR